MSSNNIRPLSVRGQQSSQLSWFRHEFPDYSLLYYALLTIISDLEHCSYYSFTISHDLVPQFSEFQAEKTAICRPHSFGISKLGIYSSLKASVFERRRSFIRLKYTASLIFLFVRQLERAISASRVHTI